MTDRELLERAAKAAGFSIVWGEMHRVGDTDVDCTDLAHVISNAPEESPAYWNPLTDDGDALRLAVKLDIYVMQVSETGMVVARIRNGVRTSWCEPMAPDAYAATRRAIVRAAATLA